MNWKQVSIRVLGTSVLSYAALAAVSATTAEAQVVVTVGVQEVYDDNIFLENDKGTPPPIVVDPSLADPGLLLEPPTEVNGDPDDDFITNAFIGLSGAIPISPHVKTAAEGKFGVIIFADNDDENRLTADAVFTISAEPSLVPAPYYVDGRVAIESKQNDISSASGTASQQSQTLNPGLNLGVRGIELSPATKFGIGYALTYNEYLGDFTFKNKNNEDLGVYAGLVDPKGSDYFTNAIDSGLDYTVTEKWTAGLFAGVTDYTFTNVETNDAVDKTEDDLDRTEGVAGVRSTYQLSEKLSVGGSVGMNLSHLKTEPDDVFVTVISDDGTTTQITQQGDQNDVSLTFGGNLSYAPEATSLLRLAVDQARRTDLDGDRLITRSASLDASKSIGDRLKLAAGGRFLQFNIGDSISSPTERYEVTASVQYSLTESLALTAGWNYTNQDADESNLEQRLLFQSEDYEGNRFFVGITAGLVGTKS